MHVKSAMEGCTHYYTSIVSNLKPRSSSFFTATQSLTATSKQVNMLPLKKLKTLGLRSPIVSCITKTLVVGDPKPAHLLVQNPFLYRHLHSEISANQEHNFTVNYLINSCGLSPDGAILSSKRFKLTDPKRADSVLALLRSHGFSETQISKVVRSSPNVIRVDPEKTLLPKLEFFRYLGTSREDLIKTLAARPSRFERSLENRLKPSYDFLRRTCLLSEKDVVTVFKRYSPIFMEDPFKNVVPNIATLRESGVSQLCISKLLTYFTQVMMLKHERFVLVVHDAKQMGFTVDTPVFMYALVALGGKSSKSIINRSREVYMRWGWSEDDVSSAFRKMPACMIVSEKKIMQVMDFFVNKMGWPSQMIAKHPVIWSYSLEKRIIPRCSVVKVLLLKGLINENFNLSTLLVPAEEWFLNSFMTKYLKLVPQLSSVYQGKMDIQDA